MKDMETSHLFNALRMIYNHTVLPGKMIPGGKVSDSMLWWSDEKKHYNFSHLLGELERHTDVPARFKNDIEIMKQNWYEDRMQSLVNTLNFKLDLTPELEKFDNGESPPFSEWDAPH